MMVLISSVANAHVNPVVSLAIFIIENKAKSTWKLFLYILFSQFVGGFVGMALCYSIVGEKKLSLLKPNDDEFTLYACFMVEMIGSFLLAHIVTIAIKEGQIMSTDNSCVVKIFAIGCTIYMILLLGTPISGASYNPAMALSNILFHSMLGNTSTVQYIWLYMCGPLTGSFICAIYQRFYYLPFLKSLSHVHTDGV